MNKDELKKFIESRDDLQYLKHASNILAKIGGWNKLTSQQKEALLIIGDEIVSIENKTYIDKTMLEGAIATAEKIKSGNPYSLYLIVTENYDVDLQIDPIYSRIDQIYVLRKSKRKGELKPIDANVVYGLVCDIKNHLDRGWSNVKKKMEETGKIL